MHKSLHSLQLFLAVQLARKGWENAFFDEQLVLQPINKLQSYFFCLHQSSCITGFPVAARKQFSSLTFSTDSAAIAIEFPAIVNPIGREEDKEGVTRIPCFGSESNALFQLLRALNRESGKGPIPCVAHDQGQGKKFLPSPSPSCIESEYPSFVHEYTARYALFHS